MLGLFKSYGCLEYFFGYADTVWEKSAPLAN